MGREQNENDLLALSNMDIEDINRELNSLVDMTKEAARLFRCGCKVTTQLQLLRIQTQASEVHAMIEGIA
jgi:hypothetical protein